MLLSYMFYARNLCSTMQSFWVYLSSRFLIIERSLCILQMHHEGNHFDSNNQVFS